MSSIDEQVIDFHYELFDCIFTEPFRPKIKDRLRRDAVARQVQEAAGAASQALTRFFHSEQLTARQVKEILRGFESIYGFVNLEDVGNPNRTPEALVEEFLIAHPCPAAVSKAESSAVYRVALHQTIQVLMLVGPVMVEWQKLSFASTYEMPRRIVSQLNQITEGLKTLVSAGQDAADDRYELTYRDHLLQRFYRVEAGTVRMTTSLNVDLRELFVMPRVTRRSGIADDGEGGLNVDALMDLAAARAIFQHGTEEKSETNQVNDGNLTAIEQLRRSPRNVIIGVPGGGKSTLFEWLQLSLANVEEELIAGTGQAIPLLLRVRQLDPKKLPSGADLIEKATASHDRAALMPSGWIDRQMRAGRVLFMLDGLDETEPEIRDKYILPWLTSLCKKYPDCLYLISSRPVGYPPGTLRKLRFTECDLQDFEDPQIAEYTRHWCTAIRIAQNDPDEEARREGAREGDQIVVGFKDHPYIRNLARNPLMLSAICLVNYFEGGQLPKDRAVLYRLCVEGLLHHWDQRRGIYSEYTLDEKLRVCREVAIAMQSDDRAEYEAKKVIKIFAKVLKDQHRAKKLFEHIRYRTGLLIERRPEVFAFAHLTFQEYLAARAVYEGNYLHMDASQLAREHADGRWDEVIALYAGSSSATTARNMIESLIKQPNSPKLSSVLAEAFLSSTSELLHDTKLRNRVIRRIALAPRFEGGSQLDRFSREEAAPIANSTIGNIQTEDLSESYIWFLIHSDRIDQDKLSTSIRRWPSRNAFQNSEIVHLAHYSCDERSLLRIARDFALYSAPGPVFSSAAYETQAEVAMLGLSSRVKDSTVIGHGTKAAFFQALRALSHQERLGHIRISDVLEILLNRQELQIPPDTETRSEFVRYVRRIAHTVERQSGHQLIVAQLRSWGDRLEKSINEAGRNRSKKVLTEEGFTSNKPKVKQISKRRRK